ncbi:MAG: protein kinase, partial [Fimbriimonadaceae bacterium]|nr:protein kinase [Fimbriimonadaceae bacterium]
MTHEPRPLPEGTLLADRFEVGEILGKGAFGIVYLARDLDRNDHVVIKELAPDGTHRREDLLLDLPAAMAHRLRRNFLNEAKTMSRLNVRGVLPVRLGFVENGTAYFATDYLPNAITLEKLLQGEGRMDVDGALDIFYQVLEILETVHAKGILHRDLKPSNILLSPAGEVTLIDFGAAREWHADSSITHTVLFTPNYAPLEQMTERARRGPATDLYALCATVYEMLSGRKPESATERASGVPWTPLLTLRPEVDPSITKAIELGLALKYSDRPQSVQAMRDQMAHREENATVNTLFELDARMVRLQRFSFERRQCPACSGLLDEPRPLRKGVCPVCHEGTIKKREIHPGKCPCCRTTVLKRFHNLDPMRTCPSCRKGWLQIRKKGLLSKEIVATCPLCESEFAGTQTEANARPWSDYLAESGRSEFVMHCDNCRSQFDELADGRLLAVVSNGNLRYDRLYPEEWDCVAAGLEPGTGNAECLVCSADFYVDGDQVTLLATKDDPFGFAKEHLGRLLTFEDNRWMAVGKFSPNPGLVCL